MTTKRSVLITGCSDGGLGAALAAEFHNAGFKVYATARSVSKMAKLSALGIDTLQLDVLDEASIASCVSKIPSLDILVNNAAAMIMSPAVDIPIPEAKKVFDVNVWAIVTVSRAFLPLLLKSKGIIVNHTSVASLSAIPFSAVYCASKAAAAMISASMRLEVQCVGIQVVELKSGNVGPTNLINNSTNAITKPDSGSVLPPDSIYQPAKEVLEPLLRQEEFKEAGMKPSDWAEAVVRDLSKKQPPPLIYRGDYVFLSRLQSILPFGWMDGVMKKIVKMGPVEAIMKAAYP